MILRGAQAQNDLIGEIGRGLTQLEPSTSASALKAIALEILTSQDLMQKMFESLLPVIYEKGWVLKRCYPRILKQRLGSRQVIAYRIHMSRKGGSKTSVLEVIGKRYADRAEGERAFRLLRLFWENGFGEESQLKVPKTPGYLSDFNLLLQEKARGTPLSSELARGSFASVVGVEMAATWLARLHSLNGATESILSSIEQGARTQQFAASLGECFPSHARELDELANAIASRTGTFKGIQATAVHGDFHPENIFVSKRGVTVIDFDNCSMADPAMDLGYIVDQIRAKEYLSPAAPAAARGAAQAFVSAYLRKLPSGAEPAFVSRIAAHAAGAYLEIMYYVLCVCGDNRSDILPGLMGEVRRLVTCEDDGSLFGDRETDR